MKKKKLKTIPEFKSEKEEAEFWDTHDTTEYEFEEEGVLEVAPHIKSPRDLSPRCPIDDSVLLTRYVDVDVAGGRLTLHHQPELYCRKNPRHAPRLAPEAERRARAFEAVMLALEPDNGASLATKPETSPKKSARRAPKRAAATERLAT